MLVRAASLSEDVSANLGTRIVFGEGLDGFGAGRDGELLRLGHGEGLARVVRVEFAPVPYEFSRYLGDAAEYRRGRRSAAAAEEGVLCVSHFRHGVLHLNWRRGSDGVDDLLEHGAPRVAVAFDGAQLLLCVRGDKLERDVEVVDTTQKVAHEGAVRIGDERVHLAERGPPRRWWTACDRGARRQRGARWRCRSYPTPSAGCPRGPECASRPS